MNDEDAGLKLVSDKPEIHWSYEDPDDGIRGGAMVVVYGAMALSGFLMGLGVGWILWG